MLSFSAKSSRWNPARRWRATSRPVTMLNLLKFKPDGGRLEYARFGAVAMTHVTKRGGKILFTARPLAQRDREPRWDMVALVRYPSRSTLLEMINDPDYLKAMPHRHAGLERTEFIVTRKVGLP